MPKKVNLWSTFTSFLFVKSLVCHIRYQIDYWYWPVSAINNWQLEHWLNSMSGQHHHLVITTIVPVYQFWSLCTSYHNHRWGMSLALVSGIPCSCSANLELLLQWLSLLLYLSLHTSHELQVEVTQVPKFPSQFEATWNWNEDKNKHAVEHLHVNSLPGNPTYVHTLYPNRELLQYTCIPGKCSIYCTLCTVDTVHDVKSTWSMSYSWRSAQMLLLHTRQVHI